MYPLTMATIGETNTIKKIGGPEETRRHLANLGFVVGGTAMVVATVEGSLIVNVKEARIAVGKELAARIMV